MTIVTARAKAFSNEGVREHRFAIDPDVILPMSGQRVPGLIRVWDDVAGHYTTCHSLSESAKQRIRKLAGD